MTTNVGLSHPQIDVDDGDQAIKKRINSGEYQPPLPAEPLSAREKISVIWPGPPNDRLQVFVSLPSPLVQTSDDDPESNLPRLSETTSWETFAYWPLIDIAVDNRGSFGGPSTVEDNGISELLPGPEPEFLVEFRTKLTQKRWVESGTV